MHVRVARGCSSARRESGDDRMNGKLRFIEGTLPDPRKWAAKGGINGRPSRSSGKVNKEGKDMEREAFPKEDGWGVCKAPV